MDLLRGGTGVKSFTLVNNGSEKIRQYLIDVEKGGLNLEKNIKEELKEDFREKINTLLKSIDDSDTLEYLYWFCKAKNERAK